MNTLYEETGWEQRKSNHTQLTCTGSISDCHLVLIPKEESNLMKQIKAINKFNHGYRSRRQRSDEEVMKEAIESRVSKLTKTQFASLLILPDSRVFLPLISGSTMLVSYACLLCLSTTPLLYRHNQYCHLFLHVSSPSIRSGFSLQEKKESVEVEKKDPWQEEGEKGMKFFLSKSSPWFDTCFDISLASLFLHSLLFSPA